MKKTVLLFSIVALTAMGCNEANDDDTSGESKKDTASVVETPKTEAPAEPLDSAAMMKVWMEYMTPGSPHAAMAAMNGKWITEETIWMDGGAPTTSKGSCENKMILGGRYQESIHKGNFNGMPFEGISTMGYDNARKVVVCTWIDNMGTGLLTMEGTYDSTSQTFTLKGKMTDPMTNKERDVRQILRYADDKHGLMEMYETPAGGKEYKSMEMKLTKV